MKPFIPLIFLAIIVTPLIMLAMFFAVVKIIYTIERIYAQYKQLPLRGERGKGYEHYNALREYEYRTPFFLVKYLTNFLFCI